MCWNTEKNSDVMQLIIFTLNPSHAEPGYALPLQTV